MRSRTASIPERAAKNARWFWRKLLFTENSLLLENISPSPTAVIRIKANNATSSATPRSDFLFFFQGLNMA
jgi:hypothetical protein